MVGLERADDAAVYRLTDEIALVQTVDFITPIVDDPATFGAIAAANSLSDVYAMGGRPLCAMNIVCFPGKTMDISVLKQILRGGLSKMREAGAVLAGGHSVEDPELKYGLSVTGIVHPQRVLTKQGAQPGDQLILTKRLGTGIVSTAVKAELADRESITAFTSSMATLNRSAAELMAGFRVDACTDITGFGLAGHLAEMIEGTDLSVLLHADRIPLLPGAQAFSEMGLLPAGLHRNRDFRAEMVEVDPSVPAHVQDVLFDPQTSGGLLIALGAHDATLLCDAMQAAGLAGATIIGEVTRGPTAHIRVC